MIGLYIFLSLLAVILLILFLKAEIVVSYGEEFALYAKILFIKIPIVPAKKKKYKSLSLKKLRKLQEKDRKKAEKKALKKAEKEAAKRKEKEKKKLEREAKKQPGKRKKSSGEKITFSDVLELVSFYSSLVSEVFRRLFGKIKTRVYSLTIMLGTGSPDTTAYEFAAVESTLSSLLGFLDKHSGLKIDSMEKVGVFPNFTDKAFESDIKIGISIRVYGALSVILPPGVRFLRHMISKKIEENKKRALSHNQKQNLNK